MRVAIGLEAAVAPGQALARGAAAGASVLDPGGPPVALYGAGLEGDAVIAGAWQRVSEAIRTDAARTHGVEILRRTTGGPAVAAGTGIVYVALALRTAGALLECPPDRVLNRNVRGALVGLSRGGVPVMYGGREFLSAGGRPVALVGWDRSAEGRVLVEMFVASARTFTPTDALDGYAPRRVPRMLGKEPTALRDLWQRTPSALDVLGHVVDGYVSSYGLTTEDLARTVAPAETLASPLDEAADASLCWSTSREIPVGLASAGVALDARAHVVAARLAGDFFQDRAAPDALSLALVGHAPSRALFAAALASTFAPGRAVIEGVHGLDALADALAEAASQ